MGIERYRKLVRDRIPEIIEASGKICKTEVLSGEEYLKLVDEKLKEELSEYYAEYDPQKKLEELADLVEVIYAAAQARGYSIEELERIRKKKTDERGAFAEKILLTEVSDPGDENRPVIKLDIVLEAVEMASDNCTYYYDMQEKESVCYMDPIFYGHDEENDDLGELIEAEWMTRFIALPTRFEINEYNIMESFIEEEIPNESVQDYMFSRIHGKGAFRRFKEDVRKIGMEQDWYDYRDQAYRNVAIEWCDENGFNYE